MKKVPYLQVSCRKLTQKKNEYPELLTQLSPYLEFDS